MPRILLDTHVALWWFAASPRLSHSARSEIERSECWLSACSIWEVTIKFKLGKLPVAPHTLLDAARAADFRLLAISPEHAAATSGLPELHSDPFDRLLIAQARENGLTLLTADRQLAAYGAHVRQVDCGEAPGT